MRRWANWPMQELRRCNMSSLSAQPTASAELAYPQQGQQVVSHVLPSICFWKYRLSAYTRYQYLAGNNARQFSELYLD